MLDRKTTWILSISIAVAAIGALVFASSGLSYSFGLEQNTKATTSASDNNNNINNMAAKSYSGTINSLVEQGSQPQYVLGGKWSLSLDGNKVTNFSADIKMAKPDGTGAHTHRMVIGGETQTAAATAREVRVMLTPVKQSVGKTVLVNATGLDQQGNVTVKVGDKIAGTTQADKDGNLLYALGVTNEMKGSLRVTVEDQDGNSGSAQLTVIGHEEKPITTTAVTTKTSGVENRTTTTSTANSAKEANDNTTISTPSMTTTTGKANQTDKNESAVTATATNSTGSMLASNETGSNSSNSYNTTTTTTPTPRTQSLTIVGGPNTNSNDNSTQNDATKTKVDSSSLNNTNATSIAETNITTTTDNNTTLSNMTDNKDAATTTATSHQTGSSSAIIAETSGNNTLTFKAKADIYKDQELKWKSVNVNVSILDGKVLSINVDPGATDNQFGDQPIFGLVEK